MVFATYQDYNYNCLLCGSIELDHLWEQDTADQILIEENTYFINFIKQTNRS